MLERIENLKPVSVVRGLASIQRLYQNRPTHALVFKLCGESLYRCRGEEISHAPGEMLLIPQGETYTVSLLTPPPSEYLLINFEGEIGAARMKKYDLSHAVDVAHLCTRILKLRAFESETDRCRCSAILYELFSMMKKGGFVMRMNGGPVTPVWMYPAIRTRWTGSRWRMMG